MNSLKQLQDCGQSIWLIGYLSCSRAASSTTAEEDGVHGVSGELLRGS